MPTPKEPCSTKSLCLYDSTFDKLKEIRKRHEKEISRFGNVDGLAAPIAWLIHHQAASDEKGQAKREKHSFSSQAPPPNEYDRQADPAKQGG